MKSATSESIAKRIPISATILLAIALLVAVCFMMPEKAETTENKAFSEMPYGRFSNNAENSQGAVGSPESSELSQVKRWDFERFDTEVTVNEDGTLTVWETQVVNFEGSFSVLNRDLSTSRASFDEGKTYGRVDVRNVKVFDLEGNPYPDDMWSTDRFDSTVRVEINFSASNEQKGWIVKYDMKGAMIYADDYDRLYWNAVSINRDVPIKESNVTVNLPQEIDMNEVAYTQYIKEGGGLLVSSGTEGSSVWWNASNIDPFAAFTIDVAFPKGYINIPQMYRSSYGWMMLILSVLIGLAGLLIMILLWLKFGRDIGRRGVLVVQYGPPKNMSPSEVGFLYKQKLKPALLSATIVHLAIRGYMQIIEDVGNKKFSKKKAFGFKATDKDRAGLNQYEKFIMSGLFSLGPYVTEKQLRNSFYVHIKGIYGAIKDSVMKREFFSKDPAFVRKIYEWVGAFIIAFFPIMLILFHIWYDLGYTLILIGGFVFAGLVVMLMGNAMPSRTAEGSKACEHIEGFKEYLQRAEALEIESMTVENFESNLAYAMALEVSDKWASKFGDIYSTPPNWYSSPYYSSFNTMYIAGSLNSMSKQVGSAMTSSPSSDGGGGFGGGSAGGGFGGGGSSAR